ncbi:hypothetical protein [Psychrobacillus sp. L4]|uniref:hypothetical protein n=1 Tax=Psychrobacillus sp. L4 TaxID=3236892 RepID=UPI0036F36824
MKKCFIACIVSIIFLVVLPFQVKGEEKDRNRGLLGESIDQLINTTEEVVDTVKTNINRTIPSQSILNPVADVEEQSIPIIEHVVSEVMNTTDSTVNNLVNVVEESVENLPEVPVVTSELKVTAKSVRKVTTEVQKTVKTVVKAVKKVNDIVENVTEKKLDNALSEEINISKPPLTPTPSKQSNSLNLVESEPPFSHIKNPDEASNKTSKGTEAHFENVESQEVERHLEKVTKINPLNSEVAIFNDVVKTNEIKNTPIKLIEAKKMKTATNTTFPLGQNRKVVVTSSAVITGSSNVTLSGVSFLLGGDIPIVLLTSHQMLKELARKKWYHKNSYAIIQWIHTPLRKPPQILLFHM